MTKLVCVQGPDFTDPDNAFDFVVQLIENLKSKKTICLFTPSRLTVEMPASDERAQTPANSASCLERQFAPNCLDSRASRTAFLSG